MKWVVFLGALFVGVPALWVALRSRERWTQLGILGFFLVLANDLNQRLSVNVISREWYRGSARGVEITAVDLIALALLLLILSRRPQGFSRRWFTLEGATLALYALMAALSTAAAQVPEYALFGLWKILRGLAIYVIFSQLIDRRSRVEALITAFALIPLWQLPFVLQQKYILGMFRVMGTLPHMNTLAMLLNLTALPVLACLLTLGRRPAAWHLVAIGAAVFEVLATGSRGGMATLAGGMALCALFIRPRHLSRPRLQLLGVMAAGGLTLMALSLDTVIERFETAPEQSKQTRLDLNDCARLMARDFPLGVGLNNYSHMVGHTPYGDPAPDLPGGGKDDAVAHHIYLLTAAELGWVGLGSFILMIGAFSLLALRLALRARDPLYRAMGIGLGSGMAALHLQGLLEWVLRQTNVWFLFCAICGTLTAVIRLERAQAREAARARRVSTWPDPAPAPSLASASIITSTLSMRHEHS